MKPPPRRRPEGGIRASQLLTSAGPGALVDLVDHAVLIKGLDAWRYAPGEDARVTEDRLANRITAELRAAKLWTGGTVELRRPPGCDEQSPSPAVGVHVRPYPTWYICQNPDCNSLVQRPAAPGGRHVCQPGARSRPVIPVRFLVSCRNGHLGDVPWRAWIHRFQRPADLPAQEDGQPNVFWCHEDPDNERWRSDAADLVFETVGSTGDIADFQVACRRCGAHRNLRDMPARGQLGPCRGWRPWLPRAADQRADREPCTLDAELLVRTASNTWFPRLRSALSIPDDRADIAAFVGDNFALLRSIHDVATLTTIVMNVDSLRDRAQQKFGDLIPWDKLLAEIDTRRSGAAPAGPDLRETEWAAIMAEPLESSSTDLPRSEDEEPWFARRLDADLGGLLERVVLVHSLREVRALVGFHRLDTPELSPEGESTGHAPMSPLAAPMPFVPAVELRGEGVFFALPEARLQAWEARKAVQTRHAAFVEACRRRADELGREVPAPTPRLLLLHSLSHMLISAISLACGYPASAIRERLYCAPGARAGVLLYTGTPGSEGTLGGLVQVGRDLVHHLQDALRAALLCSNDPTCAAWRPDHAHGRHREGAACHGCLLIAEPSCERMNRDLDRALVVPVVGVEEEVAYFGRGEVG